MKIRVEPILDRCQMDRLYLPALLTRQDPLEDLETRSLSKKFAFHPPLRLNHTRLSQSISGICKYRRKLH